MSFNSSKAFECDFGVIFKGGVGIFAGPDLSPVGTDIGNAPIFSQYLAPDGSVWYKRTAAFDDWERVADTAWNPFHFIRRQCPWISSALGGELNFTTFGTGTITYASGIASPSNKVIGALDLAVPSNGKYAGISQAVGEINFGQQLKISQYWNVSVSTLYTSAQRFVMAFGFIDEVAGVTTVTDGAWFEYNGLVSANWICKTANNLSVTSATTTVPVDTAFRDFLIVKDREGTSATFFIDNVQVAQISTNIPIGSGRNTGIVARIQKTLGNNSASFRIDHYADEYDLR